MEIGIFPKEWKALEMVPIGLWLHLVKVWLNLWLGFMFLIYISLKYDYINKYYMCSAIDIKLYHMKTIVQ